MKRVSEDSMLYPSTSNGYDRLDSLLGYCEHEYKSGLVPSSHPPAYSPMMIRAP
jgi:hypothetical protein